jgi:tetratricopeptide (TPR) repeat protein
VALSLNNLAGMYRDQGKYPYAEPLFKKALAISEKTLGLDHPNVATGLENLAQIYRDIGHPSKAESLAKRAAAIRAAQQ